MAKKIIQKGTTDAKVNWGDTVDDLNSNFTETYSGFQTAQSTADGAAGTAANALSAANTAQGTANAAIPSTQKGAANGVATLGSNGLIPSSQLPSYVDDVLEFANLAAFPATGETGKIYVALDTNLVYRWSGSAYVRLDQLTFDTAPTLGSSNVVTSDAIFKYVAGLLALNPNYQLFFIGDSLTHGTGTTGTSGGTTVPGTIGQFAYPNQVATRLNSSTKFTTYNYGYPGQTAAWFLANQAANVVAQFDATKIPICIIYFGINEIAAGTKTAQAVYKDIIDLNSYFQAAGAKTILTTLQNNKSSNSKFDTNAKRLAVGQYIRANWQAHADGLADLINQPLLYSDSAPDNSTYFAVNDVDGFSKLHLTDAGAGLLAEVVAQSISAVAKYKLPYSANESAPGVIAPAIDGSAFLVTTNNGLSLLANNVLANNTNANAYAVSSLNITADGFIAASYLDIVLNTAGVIGLDNAATNGDYATFDYALYPFNGNYYTSENTATGTDSGVQALPGDIYRIGRKSGVVKAEVLRANTTTWVAIKTMTSSSNTQYFHVAAISGKMVSNPNTKTGTFN